MIVRIVLPFNSRRQICCDWSNPVGQIEVYGLNNHGRLRRRQAGDIDRIVFDFATDDATCRLEATGRTDTESHIRRAEQCVRRNHHTESIDTGDQVVAGAAVGVF